MKYSGTVYRPPFEASSLLLQVTEGCSYNACSFCTMYHDTPFHMESFEQIEADIREAGQRWPATKRVFLENGDAFCVEADKLCRVAELIHRHLPLVETIAMYASIRNIRTKTDEELKKLRSLGLNDLNIGVESGLDEALAFLNKGYTAREATGQILRLRRAGFDVGINIIFGAGGAELFHENAAATAELLNRTQPGLIFTGTLHTEPGCRLYNAMRTGQFHECTIAQLLREEEALLEALDVRDSVYFGLHPANVVPVRGRLPEDKEAILSHLRRSRARMEARYLNSIPQRGPEGSLHR